MAGLRCEKCDRDFKSKEAINMHNKSKHPELYKGHLQSKEFKKKIINYCIMFVTVLAVSGLLYWWLVPPKNAPIIEITPSSYNFGTVSQAEGVVSGTMTITNKGNEVLILKKMDTSCGCTSAAVVYNGVEGPKFSMAMHGTNPKDWKQAILPGDSAELKVYYDPNVHSDLRGSVRRSVFVYSNDPRNKREEVVIIANQVD